MRAPDSCPRGERWNASPTDLLQQLIAEAGFSHKGLARRLNDLGAARGTPGLKYDHSSVLRWIGGQRPRDPVPGLSPRSSRYGWAGR